MRFILLLYFIPAQLIVNEAKEICIGEGLKQICFTTGHDTSNNLPDKTIQTLQTTCKTNDCTKQSSEAIEQKSKTLEVLTIQFKKDNAAADASATEAEDVIRLTQLAKTEIVKARGLGAFVVPSDNGLWQSDTTLTRDQARYIKDHVNSVKPDIPDKPPRSRRKKSAYFLKNFPALKWHGVIPWSYERVDLAHGMIQVIKQAIQDITSKTCLQFEQVSEDHSRPHLYFISRYIPGLCGLSPIGKQPTGRNTIVFSTHCIRLKVGVAVHEILHSLGILHQQSRIDRDNYIEINWNNVNPQNIDYFERADFNTFTTYGIEYDYYSVMHYPSTAGATSGNSFEAKIEPVDHFTNLIGNMNHGISSKDAELLRRMYCQPDCEDQSPLCGYWAGEGYCKHKKRFFSYMEGNCKKSCQYC